MGFGDIASRFKKHAEVAQQAAPQKQEVDPQELNALRGRIIGVLIRDARVAKGHTVEAVAETLQVTSEEVIDWEFGAVVPSLPQLELLAYMLEVPVSHFLSGTQTLIEQTAQRTVNKDEYQQIRDHMIGTMIRLAQEQAGYTTEYLAQQAHIDPAVMSEYQYGLRSVPLTDLTAIASILRVNVSFFLEGGNRVGRFLEAQEVFEVFLQLDPDVRQFLSKPSNHRYIELAMKLADMEINKLRQIAESILEITY